MYFPFFNPYGALIAEASPPYAYSDDFSAYSINDNPPSNWTDLSAANFTVVDLSGQLSGHTGRTLNDDGAKWDIVGTGTRVEFRARVQRTVSNGYVQFYFSNGSGTSSYRLRCSFNTIGIYSSSGIVGERNDRGTLPVGSWFWIAGVMDRVTGECKAVWWEGTVDDQPDWDVNVTDGSPPTGSSFLSFHGGNSGFKYLDVIEANVT